MKIAILTHGGVNRLLELLSEIETAEIVGVFIETATEPRRTFKQKIRRSIRYDGYLATAKKFSAKLLGGETVGAEQSKIVRENQNRRRTLPAPGVLLLLSWLLFYLAIS